MGMGGQRHSPAALPLLKTPYSLYRRLGGPQGWSGRVRKMSPPTGIRSPDRPAAIPTELSRPLRFWVMYGFLLRGFLMKLVIDQQFNAHISNAEFHNLWNIIVLWRAKWFFAKAYNLLKPSGHCTYRQIKHGNLLLGCIYKQQLDSPDSTNMPMRYTVYEMMLLMMDWW